MSRTDVKDAVRERYSQAAQRVSKGKSCCGGDAALEGASPIISNLYDVSEKSMLPEAAVLASLGCGNPTALAQLQPGEIVLDWARAAASTFCFPHAASAPRAKLTAST